MALFKRKRTYCDKITNTFGRNLIDLCNYQNLTVLNGRTLGDLQGQYSCFKYNGRSTVDYCIASQRILHQINHYQVSPPSICSDHASIQVSSNIHPKFLIINQTKLNHQLIQIRPL